MPKILRLSEQVINQIAAGEVVENPASIVKELLENSLDAGSKHIIVKIISGGQQEICVEDDGCGMGPEEAPLSLERYATSKLRTTEDLERLSTMGFRGEALAAIASVAHVEIKTSDGVATRVVSEGGRIVKIEPCARNRGTSIEVRSLFYNVPARKKFQKSPAANAASVRKIVETIALAHPETAFTLIANGKTVVDVQMSSQKQRVEEILGPFEHAVSGKTLSGFLAEPMRASSTRSGQYLFINRRPIFSPLIARAVKDGFGTRIAEHAYPPFVLFLEISPDQLDVNVHPQKKEVRFKEESALYRLVQKAIEGVFETTRSFLSPISFEAPAKVVESFSFPAFKVMETAPLDLTFQDRALAVIGPYLLVQREGLILVDLAGAHARILFEEMKVEKGPVQSLIWPLEIKVDEGEEIVEALGALGIECRLLQKTLVVDALPQFLEAAHFPLFLASWKEVKKIEQSVLRFTRSVQKKYLLHEALALWQRVQKCRDAVYDPQGNRIWAEVSVADLEYLLSRGGK